MKKPLTLNKKAEENFLTYAGAVIKSRAISNIEDNMKPVHRRILFSMHENKLTPTSKTMKCGRVVGDVMGKYHPHGDAAVYEALVRLAQPWKMRYPLTYIQGNLGNVLGDGPAASRYTECKLTEVGAFMLESINKKPVEFKPNYDDTLEEPALLPSKFPNVLCNGSMGIAVGLSASLVPHNYNEVADAIRVRLTEGSTVEAAISKIKGPDFPMGGLIINGEELPEIYQKGRGTIKLRAVYNIEKVGGYTHLVFTEIPYLVEIETGIVQKLKKLVTEEGYDQFHDIINNTDDKHVEIRVVLNKNVAPDIALAILFSKTNLEQTVKINNTLLQNGEPNTFSLIEMIDAYIEHRHRIIGAIAKADLEKASHKLTVVIGLQKCLSNIDLLVTTIRNADNKASAKVALKKIFELNDEQAEAVLEIKLARLSRLDIVDLNAEEKELEIEVARLNDLVQNRAIRNKVILSDLEEMRKICGDKRRTAISVREENIQNFETAIPQPYYIKTSGVSGILPNEDLIGILMARNIQEIFTYSKDGSLSNATDAQEIVGGNLVENKELFVTITSNGYVKVSNASEYKTWRGKAMKVKPDDKMIYAGFASKDDFVLLLGTNGMVMKIAISELSVTSKATLGSLVGVGELRSAMIVNDSDFVFMADKTQKGKITSVRDFSINSRTSKGQTVNEDNIYMIPIKGREFLVGILKGNKTMSIDLSKFATKSKTASGAAITAKTLVNLI
ncbi:MAG TPA: DNA gyrase subunit A [Bacilli bacterium]|nr:DNA gyrase subunit A [Bacilli bacterium]